MRFTFSISRMLMAVGLLCATFAIVKPLGAIGILFALPFGVPIALIALIARRHHTKPIIRSIVSCIIGATLGFLFCPKVHPPYEPADAFEYMIVGVIVVWLIGLTIGNHTVSTQAD